MSMSYTITIEKGQFTADYQWRALVEKDGEIVNCFLGESATLVSDEANAAVSWHESFGGLHSVKQ